MLTANGLENYYQLNATAGVRIKNTADAAQYLYLDEPAVREGLVDFSDGRMTKVTLRVPAIHCIACVWLLENLFRIKPGIGQTQVNFPRKEISVTFANDQIPLSGIVALLASLGYEPELNFSDLRRGRPSRTPRRLWIQLGVAGFAFGNIMLFSLASYLGLDSANGPAFRRLMGWFSLLLATPVVFYSALDYWRAAWISLRERLLTIDVPIAAGIVAIYAQSVFEVLTGRGEGYFDSLAGLVFFLLCGKLFQQKTYDRLAFDRDYRSFFPLSVTRKLASRQPARRDEQAGAPTPVAAASVATPEERVSISQLAPGDCLVLRNGELIPADSRLVVGPALIDYSFVTGESEPVAKSPGDYLYAGGRQIGGAIEVEMTKAVSQGYLTSLWNQDAFQKNKDDALDSVTNRYSQRFTKIVFAIALGSAAYWAIMDPARAVKAFASVLIVACPCALALAAPFALGTAVRLLGGRKVFLKNAGVVETLAKVDTVIFDKTGTLTAAGAGSVTWEGRPVDTAEERWLYSMTRHSTHPLAVRVGEAIAHDHFPDTVRSFLETAGCGMEGSVAGNEIWMGSQAWLESRGARHEGSDRSASGSPQGSAVHVAINGRYRGCYHLANALRPETGRLIRQLSAEYELALLSGDNERERERFAGVFGPGADLHFNQSPRDKHGFVRDLQERGRTVMMVGDGLNDAGALRQSDVGVAIVENVSAFSPASDVIAASSAVAGLGALLRFSRDTVRIVRSAFLVSAAYNVLGITIAATGRLSPVVCAVLMPLSSITVVAFACGATSWVARRGLQDKTLAKDVESAGRDLNYGKGPA